MEARAYTPRVRAAMASTEEARVRRRRPTGRLWLLALTNVLIVGGVVGWVVTRDEEPRPAVNGWSRLDPPERCARALRLIRHENRWPLVCRWRVPEDRAVAASFPPPAGEPPWDAPRIEVYVAPEDEPVEVARAIAHEMGHMRHTREPTFAAEWLQARRLPADTDWRIWVEDYAEVFAALYGPKSDWRAPTPPPSPAELEALRSGFFE